MTNLMNHISHLCLVKCAVYTIRSLMCMFVQRIWDELDQWHTRIAELEAEVQDLAEQQPERAQVLMDQLTEPLQLYQTTAKQAEQRTALISKVRLYP